MSRPYVVKLGDRWTWGCWTCHHQRRGFTWNQAAALALWHRWRHEVGFI